MDDEKKETQQETEDRGHAPLPPVDGREMVDQMLEELYGI